MASRTVFTAADHTWVVCAYRESPYLEDCIKSLMNQTVRSGILISTSTPNDYVSGLASHYGIEMLVNSGEPGIGTDWNYALESGKTELLTIAHQDDIYEPMYTEIMLKSMNRYQNPILFASNYDEMRNGEKIAHNKLLRIKHILIFPMRLFPGCRIARRMSLAVGNSICCPSITYRKSIMKDYHFSTDYKSNLDWDMTERLSKLKGSFAYHPRPLMCHRIHEQSTTSELIGENARNQEDYDIFRRFWPERFAKILCKMYAGSEKSNRIS